MTKKHSKITDLQVKNAEIRGKAYRLSDTGTGIRILINPNGSKYIQFRYVWAGKDALMNIGVYPTISLKRARETATEYKALLLKGINPSANRKKEKQKKQKKSTIVKDATTITFREVALEYITHNKSRRSKNYENDRVKRLARHVFPLIGNTPICELEKADILHVLIVMQEKGIRNNTFRMRTLISQIFRYGCNPYSTERVIKPYCDKDITDAINESSFIKPPKAKHRNCIDESGIPELLKRINNFHGHELTKLSLLFIAHTMVRVSEM